MSFGTRLELPRPAPVITIDYATDREKERRVFIPKGELNHDATVSTMFFANSPVSGPKPRGRFAASGQPAGAVAAADCRAWSLPVAQV